MKSGQVTFFKRTLLSTDVLCFAVLINVFKHWSGFYAKDLHSRYLQSFLQLSVEKFKLSVTLYTAKELFNGCLALLPSSPVSSSQISTDLIKMPRQKTKTAFTFVCALHPMPKVPKDGSGNCNLLIA